VGWDVTGGAGATGDGVKIQLWSYGGGTNQQWKPVVHADGSYSFTPRNNTACALTSPTARRLDGRRRPAPAMVVRRGTSQAFTLNPQS